MLSRCDKAAVPAAAGIASVDITSVAGVHVTGSESASAHGNHVTIDPQVTSGDGQFDDSDVRVGTQSIGTSIAVEKGAEADSTATEPTNRIALPPTTTATATTAPSENSAPRTTSAGTGRPTAARATTTANTDATGPGFGIVTAGCGLVLLGLCLVRR